VIVGGDTGGLLLAIALAKRGYHIAVLERQATASTLPHGEIIQPAGLAVLDQLDLLQRLPARDIFQNRLFHFRQAKGAHLCTIDYQAGLSPYPYCVISMPQVIQQLLLSEIALYPNIELFWGMQLASLRFNGEQVTGVNAKNQGGELQVFQGRILVGADGARSAVRTRLKILHTIQTDKKGYLTMVLPGPHELRGESLYYLGTGMILAIFPVSENALSVFWLAHQNNAASIRVMPLDAFKEQLLGINDAVRSILERPLATVVSWDQVTFMPCLHVRCERWVHPGAALMGDAAHAMNPHVANGRNSAIIDAIVLGEVIAQCLQKGDFSGSALAPYERMRRPSVEILQRMGREFSWLWNTGWAPLALARDRIFRTIEKRRDLHDKVLATIAGTNVQPFGFMDHLRALL